MPFTTKLFPNTVTSQLMILVTIALIFAQAINLYLLVDQSQLSARDNIIESAISRAALHVQNLSDLSIDKLPKEVRGRNEGGGRFYLSLESHVASLDEKFKLTDYINALRGRLNEYKVRFRTVELAIQPSDGEIGPKELPRHKLGPPKGHEADRPHLPPPNGWQTERRPPPSDIEGPRRNRVSQKLTVSIQLESGVWFNAITPHAQVEALTPKILFATGALLSITLLSVAFFMRRISRPLSEITHAADEFGRGHNPSILAENGPDDIRRTAQAFNRMQRRLSRMLETQRTMLRAVGHDLRTPLTSLRIRSESIPEELNRDKFIATIDEMTAMTEEILDWTKNASAIEEPVSVDLRALLSTIVDDFSDQGEDITLVGFDSIAVNMRRMAIKRALTNVIGNALKYAKDTQVSITQSATSIDIHVDDTGPGIPEEKMADALKPFVRLEPSRNKQTGGAGLGLSIAETILQAAGGKLIMKNREPKGLRVTLSLPK